MELTDGDFDDSRFPEFLSGFACAIDTGEVHPLPCSPDPGLAGVVHQLDPFQPRTVESQA